ncbi:hypothetical protein [Azospirillum brasilense]|uniref:Uncharacterized protein n=1 Tax=Azospirillum brasilense TaxID=192 RepID=A0A6L3B5T7_AZOBR|nr:hypothetical protein [Azospirillum brasilense]KAA0687734.1 hypothetical protein DS837_05905 [Azospirillum brasilense]
MPDVATPDTLSSTPVAAEPAASVIEGRVDAVQAGRIYGWAWDRSYPTDRLAVEFRAEMPDGHSVVLGRALADRPREDLVGGNFGDGHHAFETDVAIPAGLDPTRVVAVVVAPSTGTIATFAQPSAEEKLLERTLAPHLVRIGAGLDAARRDHQQIAAGQQGIARLLRETQDRIAAGQAGAGAAAAQQAALSDALHSLQERVAGLEVFLVRMDTTLRSFDDALKVKSAKSHAPTIIAALASAVGAFAATVIGLAIFG